MKGEAGLQAQLVAVLRQYARPDVLWLHIPNGEKRDAKTARKLSLMGVLAGAADLLLVVDGRAIFLELKIGKGRMSRDQERFMEAAQRAGADYHCATGFDEAIAVLNSVGALRVRLTNSVSDAASDVGMRAGGAGFAHAPPQPLTETDRAALS